MPSSDCWYVASKQHLPVGVHRRGLPAVVVQVEVLQPPAAVVQGLARSGRARRRGGGRRPEGSPGCARPAAVPGRRARRASAPRARRSSAGPSSKATTSPSSRTSSRGQVRCSSGKETVASFSLRLNSRAAPRRTSTSTRMPSHFTSCCHSSPAGTWVPRVASMGRMGSILAKPCQGRWRRDRVRSRPDSLILDAVDETRRYEMRAIWKGAVSFGLVSVPVKLYAATESHDVSFRQVHATDGGRIKYQRVCAIDGEEVDYADIAKGYETEDGEMVILTDDDMAALPSASSARSRSRSSCPATRSTRCCSRRATTSSRRRPAPSPTRCCARPSWTPTGWPSSRSRCGSGRPSACCGSRTT